MGCDRGSTLGTGKWNCERSNGHPLGCVVPHHLMEMLFRSSEKVHFEKKKNQHLVNEDNFVTI